MAWSARHSALNIPAFTDVHGVDQGVQCVGDGFVAVALAGRMLDAHQHERLAVGLHAFEQREASWLDRAAASRATEDVAFSPCHE